MSPYPPSVPSRHTQSSPASGCQTAKVKVAEPGQPETDDIARVEAVRDAIGRRGKVRVDANGGWDVDQAQRMLVTLAAFDLEYAEQPCASLDEMADLRRRVDVPLAADESIRRAEDPLRVRAGRRGRYRRTQGAAARRGQAGAGDRRGVRPAGRRVERGGYLGWPGRRGRARGRPARAAVRVRPGNDEPARR